MMRIYYFLRHISNLIAAFQITLGSCASTMLVEATTYPYGSINQMNITQYWISLEAWSVNLNKIMYKDVRGDRSYTLIKEQN